MCRCERADDACPPEVLVVKGIACRETLKARLIIMTSTTPWENTDPHVQLPPGLMQSDSLKMLQ